MNLKDKEWIRIVDKYFQTKNASGNKFDTSNVAKFLHVAGCYTMLLILIYQERY